MSNTPENKIVNKLSGVKKKKDSNLQFTNLNGKLEPDLNFLAKKENTRMVEKKIVNNKISQFKPMIGVDFHMIKK